MGLIKGIFNTVSTITKMTIDGIEIDSRKKAKDKKYNDDVRQNFETFADGISNAKEVLATLKEEKKNVSDKRDVHAVEQNEEEHVVQSKTQNNEDIEKRKNAVKKIILDNMPSVAKEIYYATPYISAATFQNAKRKFAKDVQLSDVIVLYPVGISKNGKSAYIFTYDKMLFHDQIAGNHVVIPYVDFQRFFMNEYGRSHIILCDGKDINLWDARIDPLALCTLISLLSNI